MVELQIIRRILDSKSLGILNASCLGREHFLQYPELMEFILDHYEKYNNVPDLETFLGKFPDIELPVVHEDDAYLVDTLKEEYLYPQVVTAIQNQADAVQQDSYKAIEIMGEEYTRLVLSAAASNTGTNITKEVKKRKDEHKRRNEIEGLLGIPTDLVDLDEILHGWLNEDFALILGRVNQGKSWILLYFLVRAWKAGKRVLLYSGEMSDLMVGYRFDTLLEHFSNTALMIGSDNVGCDTAPLTFEDYSKYLDSLASGDVPFVVVTPKDLGGKRLTVPVLDSLINMHNPDIIGVDQISLMDDYRTRRGDTERVQLTHIAEDLYKLSEKHQKPILADVQARRSDKKKSDDETEATPEMDEVFGADGIGQNATRIISIRQTSLGLKMSVKKNRYGINNREFLYFWDIDKGIVRMINKGEVSKENQNRTTDVDEEGSEDMPQIKSGTEAF